MTSVATQSRTPRRSQAATELRARTNQFRIAEDSRREMERLVDERRSKWIMYRVWKAIKEAVSAS